MTQRNTSQKALYRIFLAFLVFAGGFFRAGFASELFSAHLAGGAGVTQNKVTAVVHTHDGNLWLGTYHGLARFEGIGFTVFDDNNTPELRSSRITSLTSSCTRPAVFG